MPKKIAPCHTEIGLPGHFLGVPIKNQMGGEALNDVCGWNE